VHEKICSKVLVIAHKKILQKSCVTGSALPPLPGLRHRLEGLISPDLIQRLEGLIAED